MSVAGNIAFIAYILIFIVLISFFAGFIVLQVFLSKRQSRVLGLIIPIVSFIIALLNTLLVSWNSVVSNDVAPVYTSLIITFIILNIPTIVYMLIYLGCRPKKKDDHKKQLEKMNIQDLG